VWNWDRHRKTSFTHVIFDSGHTTQNATLREIHEDFITLVSRFKNNMAILKGFQSAGILQKTATLVGGIMSQSNVKTDPKLDQEPPVEAIKRMIRYTQKEADKDGRTFCSYFLDMALQSLEDGSEDLDTILKSKVTPLMVNQTSTAPETLAPLLSWRQRFWSSLDRGLSSFSATLQRLTGTRDPGLFSFQS
jgi:hypothetical protein